MLRLSIVHGAFPWLLGLAGFSALAVGLGWRNQRWRRRVVPSVAAAVAALVVIVAALGRVEQRVGSQFPPSFYAWAALPLFAAGVAAAGWWTARGFQRWVSIAAVPLLLMFGADQVDAHYTYLPTLGDAIGSPVAHQLDGTARAHILESRPLAEAQTPYGQVVDVDIPSSKGFAHRLALVWLPPAWFTTPRPQLPIVELIAGVPGKPDNMIRAGGATRIADSYAAAHGGLAPILVFPDHNGSFTSDTECVDGPRGAAETYLLIDVPGFMVHRFGASTGPGHLAIVGYSEGGTCAVTLALRHPEIVGSFVDIAGDIRPNLGLGHGQEQRAVAGLYGDDAAQWPLHDPLTLLASRRYPSTAGWFEDGRSDSGPLTAARLLVTAAERSGVATTFVTPPGGHNFAFVGKALADSFPWLVSHLGLAARSTGP